MARTIKPAAERKGEILDAAQALFFEHGYEATSVARIISAVGISKGAFYHHFDSKEALLDGMVARMVQGSIALVQPIVDEQAPALTKLNAYFAAGRAAKAGQPELMRMVLGVLYSPENLILRHRLGKAVVEATQPLMARILAQGVEDGTFIEEDASEVAEVLLSLSTLLNDRVAEVLLSATESTRNEAIEAVKRRCQLTQRVMERTLGLDPGSIVILSPGFVEALFP